MAMGVEVPGVARKRGIVVPTGGVPYCCLSWRTLGASVTSSSSTSRSERTGLPIFTGLDGVEDMAKDKVEHKDAPRRPTTSKRGPEWQFEPKRLGCGAQCQAFGAVYLIPTTKRNALYELETNLPVPPRRMSQHDSLVIFSIGILYRQTG